MKLVLLGPPASGKGTQAERLSKKLKLPQISVGELLREEYKKGTKEGKQAEKYFDKGTLAPYALVIKIVNKRLAKKDCTKGFIFDGFPRELQQAKTLLKTCDVDKVLYFKVSDKELVKRMVSRTQCPKGHTYGIGHRPKKKDVCDVDKLPLSRRHDDTPAILKSRINVFHKKTEPVLRFFKKMGIVQTVSGVGTPNQIFKRIKL
ncbi:MAG: nucleoside monophosphate kinase [Candidatus Woesearchaeota archaeon]|jgi:adenylate kinase|nr:nucleoside monophosphate kinase [Candidatus Woesearchaeota archaeon]MDP7181679.1 nucleoside monophosphate kinase [Candidatus Woesearchaeota archaeon]MDP7198768.1 nucleoside monophosphate kinase [Candidatus Woesearchaeota archaeon]MDP7467232.1 nucleoside monophosphate kinase [Candidatus Woesearchaeota archaeon]MDP7647433.1 nucleoside monophosphate kinase [Candidatus Woesearchaeota archaeon]